MRHRRSGTRPRPTPLSCAASARSGRRRVLGQGGRRRGAPGAHPRPLARRGGAPGVARRRQAPRLLHSRGRLGLAPEARICHRQQFRRGRPLRAPKVAATRRSPRGARRPPARSGCARTSAGAPTCRSSPTPASRPISACSRPPAPWSGLRRRGACPLLRLPEPVRRGGIPRPEDPERRLARPRTGRGPPGRSASGTALLSRCSSRGRGDWALEAQSLFNEMHHFTSNQADASGFAECLGPVAARGARPQDLVQGPRHGHARGRQDGGRSRGPGVPRRAARRAGRAASGTPSAAAGSSSWRSRSSR